MANKRETTLTFKKSTQNTHVYAETDGAPEGGIVPTVYIPKTVLPKSPPNEVKITLEWEG